MNNLAQEFADRDRAFRDKAQAFFDEQSVAEWAVEMTEHFKRLENRIDSLSASNTILAEGLAYLQSKVGVNGVAPVDAGGYVVATLREKEDGTVSLTEEYRNSDGRHSAEYIKMMDGLYRQGSQVLGRDGQPIDLPTGAY